MLPVAVCLGALAVLLFAERAGARGVKAAAKLTASSAFVWAAVAWGALDSGYGQVLLLGLVLCWLGDALLIPSGQSLWFQLGIAAFLLGHVAYAVAFARLGFELSWLLTAALLVGAGGAWIHRWLGSHLPADFRWPVVAYLVAISGMVVAAWGAVGGGAPVIAGVGAVGFALSDLSVARDRFVAPGIVNGAWGLPAYFMSQLALAWSVSLV